MITQPHRSEEVVTIDRRTEQTMRAWMDDITDQVNILLSSGGGGGGVTDHGALTGLADDDHSQYHNNTRGDARYYTKTLLDSGQLDSRYYTEVEVTAILLGYSVTGHTHLSSSITDFSTAVDARIASAGVVLESDYTPAHSLLVQQSGTGSPSSLQIANNRLVGRLSGGGSDIEDLTGTEVTTLLDVFTDSLQGVVPASGGGTTNFLRADGTFASPPSGGGSPILSWVI